MAKVLGSGVSLQVISLCSTPPGHLVLDQQLDLRIKGYLPTSAPVALSRNLDLLVESLAFTIETEQASSQQNPMQLGEDFEFIGHPCSGNRDWTWNLAISNCGSYIAFEMPS